MQKPTVLVTIAHPDDEAFGPSGLIAKLAGTHDVQVACVTDGASDPRFHETGEKLADIRRAELEASAKLLGVSKVHFLGYKDGSLSSNLYHEIAGALMVICRAENVRILVTFEFRGISGHLDHVAVSMITSYVYTKLPEIDAILYNATSRQTSNDMSDYFIFFPPGYDRDDVDLVVDISSVYDKKIAAARCHDSQKGDVERVIGHWEKRPKEEYYFITKRRDFTI